MTDPAPPPSEWRDPRYLRTHRGLLVHRAADGVALAQAEADLAPKNLVIALHSKLGWRLVHLHDDALQIRPRTVITAALADPAQCTVIDDVVVEPVPGPDNFALRQARLYLSAGKTPELRFEAPRRLGWEVFDAARPGPLAYQLWRPSATMGGTQLMERGLLERLGAELNAINLQLHWPDPDRLDARPLVVWLHNDIGIPFDWCTDAQRIQQVAAFVFVSHWQRHRFLTNYPALPPDRCTVIRNATDTDVPARSWRSDKPWRWRCAYTSAPNRGLSVLLDAWERLDPGDAELHIWSSFRLWGNRFSDTNHHALFAQARRLPGVTYHGIRPNAEIRSALADMHFLTYPTTFPETSCIAVIEAMAAGMRVISTSRAALPETTAGFAHLCSAVDDREANVTSFAQALAEEFRSPWGGQPSTAIAAQDYTRAIYGWPTCLAAWRHLIKRLTTSPNHPLDVPG